MFTKSAAFYDVIYAAMGKDYAGKAQRTAWAGLAAAMPWL